MEGFVQDIFQSLLNLGLKEQQAQQIMQSMQKEHVEYLQQVYQQNPKDKKALAEATAQVIQAMQKAMHGAKLNYINRLNNRYQMFAKGGCAKKKVKKYQTGDQMKQPFTGFEGIDYSYEAPVISRQGRAERPEVETLRNKNSDNYYSGAFMSKEGFYDPDVYEDEGRMQYVEGEPMYFTRHNSGWKESTDTEKRAFNHLKRHALNNRHYDENAMQQRAEAMKMINSLSPTYKKRF